MTSKSAFALAPAPNYDGFYLRDNLKADGSLPSDGPYNLCPDIIQSDAAIPGAQSTLSTLQSWAQMYGTDPTIGQVNYYYVRGINGAPESVTSRVHLYYAPAQLIMFPGTWKNNALTSAKGLDYVNVAAAPGHIDVGDNAFLWNKPPLPPEDGDFYSFVAQVNDEANSNPIPPISSWLDMGQLLSQNLGFGFRNTCAIDGASQSWYHRLMLNVPTSFTQWGQLTIIVSANGFVGDTIGLIGNLFTSEQKPLIINPFKITQDGSNTGIPLTVSPGFASSIALQYWNTSGNTPAPGASISIEVDYTVPPPEVTRAVQSGLVSSTRHRHLQETVGIGPQPTVPLGAATFIVANSTTAV